MDIQPLLPLITKLFLSVADNEPEETETNLDRLFIALPPKVAAAIIKSVYDSCKPLAVSYIITYVFRNVVGLKEKPEQSQALTDEFEAEIAALLGEYYGDLVKKKTLATLDRINQVDGAKE